ncbi:MAG: glycosyltransferase family 92 protein, partial [Anaerolineae bacterium]|nr:glycosyltransferase family 92 protein [Anaerolineae bacterium]
MRRSLRVVALLQVYNGERFITACLEHLISQGVQVHLTDNCSTDRTVELAERYLGRGLIGIDTLPRGGTFSLRPQLEHKERLAEMLDADWFMHVDVDEFRVPVRSGCTLAEAFREVENEGYNAVNFMEFTFIPTRESPDHDHPYFQETMRWYYPFQPFYPHRLNAWKRQPCRVELAWSAGHEVRFPGLRMYPQSFPMRHYLFLSLRHAVEKFVATKYDPQEVASGWFRWRARIT